MRHAILYHQSFARMSLQAATIAATNRELDEAVGAGVFREDLLFGLKSLSIRTPPLRERREDILVQISRENVELVLMSDSYSILSRSSALY